MASKTSSASAKGKALVVQAVGVPAVGNEKDFLASIDVAQDFALIPRAGGFIVEPKRDLILKIVAFFGLSYDTEIKDREKLVKKIPVSGKKEPLVKENTMYTVKATVSRGERFTTGLGMCSTETSSTDGREDHDALTKAETRALKRAVEGFTGLPIINQLIIEKFGNYSIGPQRAREMGLK